MKVFDLELFDHHYYIKRNTIVEQIQFDNRTFYAKFERINEPLTSLLLEQHLSRQYTIAAPLVEDNVTNYLVVEYKGEEYLRFQHLVKHLFISMSIEDYFIYQGKDIERVQIFIHVDHLSLEEADAQLKIISNALKEKMTKKWKCLPSLSLPEAYNIVTLPYQKIAL
ncbi:MAG: hypothetical protein RL113_356 [Pseudomonadota bacterium]